MKTCKQGIKQDGQPIHGADTLADAGFISGQPTCKECRRITLTVFGERGHGPLKSRIAIWRSNRKANR